MPVAIENANFPTILQGANERSFPRFSQPLQYTGSLDLYDYQDLTPAIGREYSGIQIEHVLKSDQRDQQIRDLAVTSK